MIYDKIERLSISLDTETARIHRDNSAVVHLPLDVLNRSTLLRTTLSEAAYEESISITLPSGFLDAWLESLRTVEVAPVYLDRQRGVEVCERSIRTHELLKYLEVADFMDDQLGLAELCEEASCRLFETIINSEEASVDTELATGLVELPTNLRISVLASVQLPLHLQLHVLPKSLHEAALHAAFPSIAASSSITVPFNYFATESDVDETGISSKATDAFWGALGQQTRLRTFQCSLPISYHHDFGERKRSVPDCLLASIANLSRLVTLSLPQSGDCRFNLTDVVSCLSCQQTLEHLCVAGNALHDPWCGYDDEQEGWQKIAKFLASCTRLQSLDLSGFPLGTCAVEVLAPCIGKLTGLTSLSMSNCRLCHDDGAVLAPHLSRLTALKTFRYDGNVGHVELLRSLQCCAVLRHLELLLLI